MLEMYYLRVLINSTIPREVIGIVVKVASTDSGNCAILTKHGLLGSRGKYVLYSPDDLSKIEIESLTLHEANPGHHYQLTYVNESNLPLFMKCFNNESYHEGWALYCENLGEYLI